MLFRIANDPVPSRSEPIPRDLVLLHPVAMYEELFRYSQLAQQEGYKIPKEFGDLRQIGAFKNWWYGKQAWKLFAVKDESPVIINASSTRGITLQITNPKHKDGVLEAIKEFLETGEIKTKDTSKFQLNMAKDYTFDERDQRKFYVPLSRLSGEGLKRKIEELGASKGIVGFLSTWGRLAAFRAAYSRLIEYEGDELQKVKAAHSLGYFSDISNIKADDFIMYASLENAYNKTKTRRTFVEKRGIEREARNATIETEFRKLEDSWRSIAVGEHLFQTENGSTAKVVLDKLVDLNKLDFIKWKIDKVTSNLDEQKNKCIETFIGIGATPFSFPVKKALGERRMPAIERKKYMDEAARRKAAGKLAFS